MDNLFSHPGFRLIYVDDTGGMSLVAPLDRKEDILDRGYRCISHYWGPSPPKWEDHPVKGVHWSVHVREEKQERLLQVFNHHKGYFWMDVFCTNQDDDNKPLDAMGDIYRNCVECICLLDTICAASGFASERDVLMDIAKDIGERSEIVTDPDDCVYGDIGDTYEDFANYDINTLQEARAVYFGTMIHGNWSKRVWTLQEAALPPKLLFCSERARSYKYDPIDHQFLKKLFPYKVMEFSSADVGDINAARADMNRLEGFSPAMAKLVLSTLWPISRMMQSGKKYSSIWDNIRIIADSGRKCTSREDFVYGIAGVLNVSIPKNLTLDEAMVELEKELQKQGIFVAEGKGSLGGFKGIIMDDTLAALYRNRRPMDGVAILGNITNIDKLGNFNTDVGVLIHEDYGEILSKNIVQHDEKIYQHVGHRYETNTHVVLLETDGYSVGDTLEVTKVGREGCTFERRGGKEVNDIFGQSGEHRKNEIFEIVGNRVRIVGYAIDKSINHEE